MFNVLLVVHVYFLHAVLEALYTLAQTLHELGNLLASEQQQHKINNI